MIISTEYSFIGSQYARVTAVTDQSRVWTEMIYEIKISNQPLTDSLKQCSAYSVHSNGILYWIVDLHVRLFSQGAQDYTKSMVFSLSLPLSCKHTFDLNSLSPGTWDLKRDRDILLHWHLHTKWPTNTNWIRYVQWRGINLRYMYSTYTCHVVVNSHKISKILHSSAWGLHGKTVCISTYHH